MGDAQSIPVLGEVVTVIDSGAKTIAAGACAMVGQTDAAGKLIKGAGNSWVEYSEKNLVAGLVNATASKIQGDEEECERISKKILGSLEGFVDSVPAVGHVKGIGHYIAGDTEHGNKCMLGATRGVAVLGAGLATGGLGGGLVAGGLAGAGSGVTYDFTASVIDSVVHDENRPHGICATIDAIDKEGDPNNVVDLSLGLVGDFVAGAEMGKAAQIRYQKNAVANAIENAQEGLSENVRVSSKVAAKDTIKAAKNLNECLNKEGLKGDGHVSSVVRDLETNETHSGFSARVRANKRVRDYEANRGNFRSKGQARRCTRDMKSELQNKNPDVAQKVSTRRQNACAEHDAFNKFYKNSSANASNAVVCSVQYLKGAFRAIMRCENCLEFAEAMGNVVTDLIDGQVVPVENIRPYIVKGCACGAMSVAKKS